MTDKRGNYTLAEMAAMDKRARLTERRDAQVFKVIKTEFYTRILLRPNRWGNVETANRRKVVEWCYRVDGRTVTGFATKAQAVAAARLEGQRNDG